MHSGFDPDRITQIRAILQERETEELLAAWWAHNEDEWTPEAFAAMRSILRERLGDESTWPTEPDPEAEEENDDEDYVCSNCGASVGLTDKYCRECGANIEEVVDSSGKPRSTPKETEHILTFLEINLLAEATRLPADYAQYFDGALGEEIVIPPTNPKIGGLEVQVLPNSLIRVTISDHTEEFFETAPKAIDFINEVLTDQMVFFIDDEGVEVYHLQDLQEDWMDDTAQVWSGPLRNL